MKPPQLPELEGSHLAREHAAAAVEGTLTLQRCGSCGAVQYPFREVCAGCLAGTLEWRRVDGAGVVIAAVGVHAAQHPFFRGHAPWRICSVALDAGPRVIAHTGGAAIESGDRVEVFDERAGPSCCVLVAKRPETSR